MIPKMIWTSPPCFLSQWPVRSSSAVRHQRVFIRVINVHQEDKAPSKLQLQCDREACRTWVYPLNKTLRDYQFNIVKACLLNNCLVALPTGLGKTFIASVVMMSMSVHTSAVYRLMDSRLLPMVPARKSCISCANQTSCIATNRGLSFRGRHSQWRFHRAYWQHSKYQKTCWSEPACAIKVSNSHILSGKLGEYFIWHHKRSSTISQMKIVRHWISVSLS